MKHKAVLLPILGLALLAALATTYFTFGGSFVPQHMRQAQTTSFMATDGMMGEKMAVGQAEPMMGTSYPMPPYYGYDDALGVENRIYQTSAHYSVVADNVSEYIRQQKEFLSSIDAVILSSSFDTSSKYEYGFMYVKVPNDRLDEATRKITGDAQEVVNESVTSTDVTGQKAGIDQQVQNLEDQIALKEIELVEAQTTVDKNRIQLQIDRLNQQLQQLQDRQQNFSEEVQYSDIYLSVSNNARQFDPNAAPTLTDQFQNAWDSLSGIGYIIGVVLIWFLVYAIVWLPIVLLVAWFIRRRKNSQTAEESVPKVKK